MFTFFHAPYYMFTIFFHIKYICTRGFASRPYVHTILSYSVCLFTFFHTPTICPQSSFTLAIHFHILLTTVTVSSHSEVTFASDCLLPQLLSHVLTHNVPLYNTHNPHIPFYAASLIVYRHDLQQNTWPWAYEQQQLCLLWPKRDRRRKYRRKAFCHNWMIVYN
jgi:hypothetical protein